MANQLDEILDPNEKILWRGKPQYLAYVLEAIPASMFGLFWCLFLVPFYWGVFTHKAPVFVWLVLGPHTLVGVALLGMPLWASLRYPYIEYAITTKRIIIQSGFFARNFNTVDYTELTDVSVNVGFIGKLTNTGDVDFVSGVGVFTPKSGRGSISGIQDPYGTFKLLKQTYFDIKTDVEFPNKLRPPVNPGYQSEYEGPSK